MKSTTTTQNTINAQRLLELRETIKQLTKEESTLKQYFNELLDHRNTDSLIVNTAILISRSEVSRTSYDSKQLETYFNTNNLNPDYFKKTVNYTTLKLSGVK